MILDYFGAGLEVYQSTSCVIKFKKCHFLLFWWWKRNRMVTSYIQFVLIQSALPLDLWLLEFVSKQLASYNWFCWLQEFQNLALLPFLMFCHYQWDSMTLYRLARIFSFVKVWGIPSWNIHVLAQTINHIYIEPLYSQIYTHRDQYILIYPYLYYHTPCSY